MIKPLGFELSDKGLRRASMDYTDIADITIHSSFQDIFSLINVNRIYGAVTEPAKRYDIPKYMENDAVVFGPESSGLPNDVLAKLHQDNRIRIPMVPGNRSLNLSNAVAIVTYEIWRQLEFIGGDS